MTGHRDRATHAAALDVFRRLASAERAARVVARDATLAVDRALARLVHDGCPMWWIARAFDDGPRDVAALRRVEARMRKRLGRARKRGICGPELRDAEGRARPSDAASCGSEEVRMPTMKKIRRVTEEEWEEICDPSFGGLSGADDDDDGTGGDDDEGDEDDDEPEVADD